VLSIQNVSKSFAGFEAVKNLSFEVRPGEIYGLLGPNGAGKTTTLSMIAGLLVPDSGRIRLVSGESGTEPPGNPLDPEARLQLGLAPQLLALYETLTAEQNLRFFARMLGFSGDSLTQAVADALELAELSDRANEAVSQYSGGMKRRLNLAVAMLHRPQNLLLDEPTVGVDPQSRNALLDSIMALRDAGHSILYTTHYMEEAQKICDRVGIMDHGHLLAEGTVAELIHQYGGDYHIRLQRQGEVVHTHHQNPVQVLNEWGFDPDSDLLSIKPPDLESVFLNLTGRTLRD